jgi:hypothetical protein
MQRLIVVMVATLMVTLALAACTTSSASGSSPVYANPSFPGFVGA